MSGAAILSLRPIASSPSPTACSRCPTPMARRRPPGCASASMGRSRPLRSCSTPTACARAPAPCRFDGRVPAVEGESGFAVDADLPQAGIDKLVPGWQKPPDKQARATFTAVTKPNLPRLDDFRIEAHGTEIKGTVEINETG